MASTDDLARLGGNVATRGGAPAVRPPPVPTEGLRTYTPEQMSQLGAPKAPLQIGGPSPVPAVQAPLYTPEGAPQLGAGRPVAGIGGPSQVPAIQSPLYTPEGVRGIGGPGANLPARQAPMYTPEQAPRLGAPSAASGIGSSPAAAATPAEAAASGPLSRAAGLLGKIGKGIGVGAIADQALRAVDPADSMGSWIDKNVPGASWVDNAASHIGLGRSYAEQRQAAAPQLGARQGIIPTAAAATMPQTSAAPAEPAAALQAAAPSPDYTDELQRIQGQAAAEQPPQASESEATPPPSAPASAASPDAGQPNPISFITYGAAQGADGGSGALVTNKDGTQVPLDTRQPPPADVQAFNALNQQAGQNTDPVQVIRGTDQTTAVPNANGGPMQEVPQDVANGGPTAINGFLAARQQNALNQADPLKAKTDAEIRKDMVTQGMGDPTAPGGAGIAGMAATQGLSGDDYLKTLQPSRAALIKSIIGGGMQVSPFIIAKNPGLMSQVAQADPTFDVKDMNARSKLQSSFKAGPDAENIKSLNTAMAHIAHLNDHLTALNNGDYPAYNAAANWIGNQIGNTKIQGNSAAVETDAKGVAGEMAKVFRSSGMSEHEITDWKNSFSTATTPAAQKATIEAAMGLLKGRMDAIGDKYTRGMGAQAAMPPILTKENQAAFDRLSGKAPQAAPGTPAPAGPASSISQAHIAALKANPQRAAEFDAKFGPGASASILGK